MTRFAHAFVVLAACATSPALVMKSPPLRPHDARLADLSDVRGFHNYVAVTGVEYFGAHFTVWYRDVEPTVERVNVWRDPDGSFVLATEGGYSGGLGVAPREVRAVPAAVEPLARAVERELARRNPGARHWKLQYDGDFRSVDVAELIAQDDGSDARRGGWSALTTFAMDASLSTITKTSEARSGFGVIEVPADAQWVELPRPGTGSALLTTAPPPELAAKIGEAARRFEAKAPPPPLASLVPANARLLPDGFVARVAARVSVFGRSANGNRFSHHFVVPLDLHDAVFGAGSAAAATVELGGQRYTLRVALTATSRRAPQPGRARDAYAGTLAVHLDDGRGHAWEHQYPCSGPLVLDGDQVVAPTGFVIPGASGPSKEADARHGELPGFGAIQKVDAYVDVSVVADPRD